MCNNVSVCESAGCFALEAWPETVCSVDVSLTVVVPAAAAAPVDPMRWRRVPGPTAENEPVIRGTKNGQVWQQRRTESRLDQEHWSQNPPASVPEERRWDREQIESIMLSTDGARQLASYVSLSTRVKAGYLLHSTSG